MDAMGRRSISLLFHEINLPVLRFWPEDKSHVISDNSIRTNNFSSSYIKSCDKKVKNIVRVAEIQTVFVNQCSFFFFKRFLSTNGFALSCILQVNFHRQLIWNSSCKTELTTLQVTQLFNC